MDGLRLDMSWLDYLILGIYLLGIGIGIGFAARRSIKTSLDVFLSGRSRASHALNERRGVPRAAVRLAA